MKNEVWKDIPNYEGLYQASNLGRIRSLDINGNFVKLQKNISSVFMGSWRSD